MRANDPTASFMAILEREELALRTGNLDALEQIAKDKSAGLEKLLRSLRVQPISSERLERIKETARNNAKLIIAARKAVSDVQKLRRDAKTGVVQFTTYSRSGKPTSV